MTEKTYNAKELGAVTILMFAMFTAGTLIANLSGEQEIDEEQFQKIMNEQTLHTLEKANNSFQNEDTETGIQHTETAATMIWSNIQVTDKEAYSQLWRRLSFDCILESNNNYCKTTVTTAHEAIINELPHDREIQEEKENGEASVNNPPEIGDSVDYATQVKLE